MTATPHPKFGHPLIRIAFFLAVFALIGGVGLGISYLIDPTGPEDGAGMLVTAIGLITAALVAYYTMVRILERRRPDELGLHRLPGGFSGFAVGALLTLICGALVWALGGLVIDGVRPASAIPWVSDLIMTSLFSAVVEEIVFRGIAFRFIEQWLGSWTAVAASALIFGAVHIFAVDATWFSTLATAAEAGLLFAMILLVTRSLWWVIGVHAGWNFVLSIILGVPVSGNINEGLLITRPAGPEILSGGAYGLEASLVSFSLLSIVAIVGLWWAHKRGLMLPAQRPKRASNLAPQQDGPPAITSSSAEK